MDTNEQHEYINHIYWALSFSWL